MILQHMGARCLGNHRETNNETTTAARQHILKKQIYVAVTE
jgi:hypothetical protein